MDNIFRIVHIKKFLKSLKKAHENSVSLKKSNKFLNFSTKEDFQVYLKKEFSNLSYFNYYRNTISTIVSYIITIKYTKVNTLLSVTDSKGFLLFFVSAGQVLKKKKVSRMLLVKKFVGLVLFYMDYLKVQPIALHLKNVDFKKVWLINFMKCYFFIKTIKIFTVIPHNGCRKRKKKRKKFRSFAKKK